MLHHLCAILHAQPFTQGEESSIKSFLSEAKNDWRILTFGFAAMFFTAPGQTYFISLFGAEIREGLDISHGEFGTVYSLATLLSAFVLLKSGSFIDKFDLPKLAMSLGLMIALACFVFANSDSIISLFIGIFLLRQCGQGLMSMTASTAMMRYMPNHKAKSNAFASMGYSTSEALLPSLIVFVLLYFTWREAWLMIALFALCLMPLTLALLLRNHQQRHTHYLQERENPSNTREVNATSRQWTRAEVVRDPLLYMFLPGLLMHSMLYTGFMFHQIQLITEKGWPLSAWSSFYVIYALVAIAATFAAGWLSDKLGAERLVPWILVPMVLGLNVIANGDELWRAAIYMVLLAISTGAQAALSAPFFSERYGTKHFASIKSIGTFTMMVMTAISPIAIGWMIDYDISMSSIAVGASLLGAVAISIAYLAYRKSLNFE